MSNRNCRIIIAGGGTGGHIFPGLAIAGSLQKLNPGVEILFVGAKGKMEMTRVPKAGYAIQGIDIAGFNRSSLFKNISLPVKLCKSYFQVKRILHQFKPDGVVGVGGYSSLPVLRLAQAANIPTFIHESNSLPGKSNLILGKRAAIVFVASDGMQKYFPEGKISVSGNPVRARLQKKEPKDVSLKFFGLDDDKKTVLAVGGSLGAKSINDAISENLSFWKESHTQLIWQTGKNFSEAPVVPDDDHQLIWRNTFIDKMEYAYGGADVVIARAGAMTIAELEAQGKASILVPYPFAAEDHQTVNARRLEEKGAAIMIPDREVKEKLIPALKNLLRNQESIKMMEKNVSQMARTDADRFIAGEILKKLDERNN